MDDSDLLAANLSLWLFLSRSICAAGSRRTGRIVQALFCHQNCVHTARNRRPALTTKHRNLTQMFHRASNEPIVCRCQCSSQFQSILYGFHICNNPPRICRAYPTPTPTSPRTKICHGPSQNSKCRILRANRALVTETARKLQNFSPTPQMKKIDPSSEVQFDIVIAFHPASNAQVAARVAATHFRLPFGRLAALFVTEASLSLS